MTCERQGTALRSRSTTHSVLNMTALFEMHSTGSSYDSLPSCVPRATGSAKLGYVVLSLHHFEHRLHKDGPSALGTYKHVYKWLADHVLGGARSQAHVRRYVEVTLAGAVEASAIRSSSDVESSESESDSEVDVDDSDCDN